MPWLPDSVFRASVVPEAVEGEADAEAEGDELGAVEAGAAGVLVLDALLQAAAAMAVAASVRPRPDLRIRVLLSMKILS